MLLAPGSILQTPDSSLQTPDSSLQTPTSRTGKLLFPTGVPEQTRREREISIYYKT